MYIHEERCQRHREDAGFPEDLRSIPLTLNGYGRGRVLRAQEYVTDGRVEEVVLRLLDRRDIDYIHVRNTEAGCYIARLEPVEESPAVSSG